MTIEIKWLLVIIFTIAYIAFLTYHSIESSKESGIGAGLGLIFWGGFATILYAIFWIIWLIIY